MKLKLLGLTTILATSLALAACSPAAPVAPAAGGVTSGAQVAAPASSAGMATAPIIIGGQATGLNVQGEGSVRTRPDLAIVQIGVEQRAPTAEEAQRQAATAIVQGHHVEEFLWLRYDQQCSSRPGRAYRHREAGIKVDRHATVEVRVDEAALESAVSRLGWRVYVTNQPSEQLSLEQAVLAYRSEYLVERSLGRLKGRPLSLTPMYVQRDDHATGLIRLLSIALRVLTLLEFVGVVNWRWSRPNWLAFMPVIPSEKRPGRRPNA